MHGDKFNPIVFGCNCSRTIPIYTEHAWRRRSTSIIVRLLFHPDRGLLDPPTGEPAWHNSIGTTCYVVARPTSCMQRINEVFKPHIFLKRLLKRVFNGIKCGNDDVIRRAYIINTHFRISVLTIVIGLDYMWSHVKYTRTQTLLLSRILMSMIAVATSVASRAELDSRGILTTLTT